MDAAAIPGAVCGLHPDQPITFTCARCGTFGCDRCRSGDGTICASCVARSGVAPIEVGAIIKESFSVLPKTAGRLLAVSSIQLVTSLAAALWTALVYRPMLKELTANAGRNPNLDSLIDLYAGIFKPLGWIMLVAMITGALTLAWWVQIFGDAARNQQRPLRAQVVAGLRAYPVTLVTMLVRGLGTVVGMVFCCVPGFALYGMFGLAASSAGLSRTGLGSLVESWRLARRRFWLVMGVEAVGMAGIVGASMVGSVVSQAMGLAGTPGVYVGAVASTVISLVPTLMIYAMETVLYVRILAVDGAPAK